MPAVLLLPFGVAGRAGGLCLTVGDVGTACTSVVGETEAVAVPSDGVVGATDFITSAPARAAVTNPRAPKPIHTARGRTVVEDVVSEIAEVDGIMFGP